MPCWLPFPTSRGDAENWGIVATAARASAPDDLQFRPVETPVEYDLVRELTDSLAQRRQQGDGFVPALVGQSYRAASVEKPQRLVGIGEARCPELGFLESVARELQVSCDRAQHHRHAPESTEQGVSPRGLDSRSIEA